MTLESLELTLNPGDANERRYEITMLQSVDLSSTKEAFSIAPPGLAASENLLLGVSGMQADLTVNWAIHDDGADKASGTAPTGVFSNDTVVTIEEQITYLEEYVHAPDFDADWQLDHLTGAAFNDDDVFLEQLDIPVFARESPRWRNATMRLRRGQSI